MISFSINYICSVVLISEIVLKITFWEFVGLLGLLTGLYLIHDFRVCVNKLKRGDIYFSVKVQCTNELIGRRTSPPSTKKGGGHAKWIKATFLCGVWVWFSIEEEKFPPFVLFSCLRCRTSQNLPTPPPLFNFYFTLCVVVVGGPITELCAFFFFFFEQISFCQVCHFFVYFAAPFLFPVWGLASLQIQSEQ